MNNPREEIHDRLNGDEVLMPRAINCRERASNHIKAGHSCGCFVSNVSFILERKARCWGLLGVLDRKYSNSLERAGKKGANQ